MSKESNLIMKRRFLGRILESGLLIIAVALGVGAAASGLSLFFHTNKYNNELLKSPEYREIIASSNNFLADMDVPVAERENNQYVSLSTNDLKVGNIIDGITFSYIKSEDRLRFLTKEFLENQGNNNFFQQEPPGPPDAINNSSQQQNSSPEANSSNSTRNQQQNNTENNDTNQRANINAMIESFSKVIDDPNYIIPEVEELFGYEITDQFFNAWNLDVSEGSLFTTKDYTSSTNYILLGYNAAKLLNVQNFDSLTGKKIISRNSRTFTVSGVLKETGMDIDNNFYVPKKEQVQGDRFNFRRGGNDNQLRFYVQDVTKLNVISQELKEYFDKLHGEGKISVSNPRSEAMRVLNRNNGISFLILFLSLAGLFIASVNVSNILISRSIRMKKYVGILKALGATKVNIIVLFIKEGILITGLGTILGAALAIPLSISMEKSLGINEVSWKYIFIGVLLSSILTLFFSVLPARQNASIEPAEAMRSVS